MIETGLYIGDHYRPGDYWVICDECGRTFRKSKTRKRWDGMIVCFNDWEPRHPQEFIRGRADRIAVKDARIETYQARLNDDCTSTTGWTLGSGWTHNTDEFYHSSGVNTLSRALTGLTDETVYQLMVTVTRYVSGELTISLTTSADEAGDLTVNGDTTADISFSSSGTTDTVVITPSSDFIGSISGLSVYPVNSSISQSDL
jgi:hypothetical protein